MIRDLRAASPDFDDAWQSHEVTWAPTGTRCLAHPAVGRLDLDFQNLLVAGQPGLRITVYSGEPGTATFERLGWLRELLEQAP